MRVINNNVSSDMGSLLRCASIYFLSDAVLKLIGFFLVPLYTRLMPTQDYGILGYTNALAQILTPLVSLGLIGSLPILYYSYSGDERRRLISSVVNFTLLYSLAVTLLIVFLGPRVFSDLNQKVAFQPYILLTVWGLFFATFYYLPLGIFNMQEKALSYAGYSIGIALLNIAVNVFLVAFMRLGVIGALLSGLLSGGISMIVALRVIRKDYLAVVDLKKVREILLLSLPALPHLFSSNLWRFADRIFLTGMADLSVTGIYSLAMTMSMLILMVLSGMATALNPVFYKRAHAKDSALAVDWARLCSLFVFAAIFASLLLIAVGPELIKILAPAKYHGAGSLLPILVLGQVFTGLYWLMAPGIGFTRKTWVYPVASFPAVLVNIFLNLSLIPRFGASGAAWALAGSAAVQFAIFTFFSNRFFPVPYELGQITKIAVLGGCLAAPLIRMADHYSGVSGFFIKAAVVMILPVALYIWGFFSKAEIAALRSFIKGGGR